jgi:hypothetical protein
METLPLRFGCGFHKLIRQPVTILQGQADRYFLILYKVHGLAKSMCDSQGTMQLSEPVSCNFLLMTWLSFTIFLNSFKKIRDATLTHAASYLTLPNSPSSDILSSFKIETC